MKNIIYFYSGLLIALLVACQSTSPTPMLSTATATEDLLALVGSVTAIPTVIIASNTPIPIPTDTVISPTVVLSATLLPTESPTATLTQLPAITPLPSPRPILERLNHYWLERPIAQDEGKIHWLDRSYPYGGTQFGQREVHLGVEFSNTRFTPIIAAADGIVIYAGEDSNLRFGPEFDYYGNLLVIQHPFISPDGLKVYTLYAHLQDIAVQKDEPVLAGQRLGRVGDTGIAVGPHLHFEVRLGDAFDFLSTRNPDLWIKPYNDFGTLAGRVIGVENPYGIVLSVRSDTVQRETYTYGAERVNSDAAWNENFTLGDLPVDTYQVTISNRNGRNYFREQIIIIAGQTVWLEVDLSDSNYQP
jgi:murein DD-endopeptidase MepM/ murein hydrolase activator NlpD